MCCIRVGSSALGTTSIIFARAGADDGLHVLCQLFHQVPSRRNLRCDECAIGHAYSVCIIANADSTADVIIELLTVAEHVVWV